MAHPVESAYVGRRFLRPPFETRNRSDPEDSFRLRSAEFITEVGGIPGQFQTIGRERGDSTMKAFPSEQALVAAYWRRLARSIDRTADGKRKKSSLLKSQAGSGVWHCLTGSRNVKPVIPTRVRVAHTCGAVDRPTSNQDRDDKRLIGRKMLKRCALVAKRGTAGALIKLVSCTENHSLH